MNYVVHHGKDLLFNVYCFLFVRRNCGIVQLSNKSYLCVQMF